MKCNTRGVSFVKITDWKVSEMKINEKGLLFHVFSLHDIQLWKENSEDLVRNFGERVGSMNCSEINGERS